MAQSPFRMMADVIKNRQATTPLTTEQANLDIQFADDVEAKPKKAKKNSEQVEKKIKVWWDQFQDAKQERNEYELLWNWCAKILDGQQNHYYDSKTKKIDFKSKLGGPGSKLCFNRVLPIYRQIVSRLAVEFPAMSVLPGAPSPDNIVKAKVSEEICRFHWHSQDMKSIITEAIESCVTFSGAGFHAYYDPEDGKVKSRFLSPYDIFWAKNVRRWEESPWWAVRNVSHRDEMMLRYADRGKEAVEAIKNAKEASKEEYPPDHIEYYDVYWRDGTYAIMLEKTALWTGTYNPKALPVQYFRYTNIPGRVYGAGLVELLINPQLLYNRKRNRIIDALDLMGDPVWIVPNACNVSDSMFKVGPGAIIRYNAIGGKPERVSGVNIPDSAFRDIERIEVELEDMAGLHATSMGKTARGVRSARHVEALSAHDDTQLLMTQTNIEKAIALHSKAVLVLMQEHYEEESTLSMFDEYVGVIFKTFKGTDIVDDPEINLEAGSLFQSQTMDREARVMDLLQVGVLTVDEAREAINFKTMDKSMLDKVQAMSHALDMLREILDDPVDVNLQIYPTDDVDAFEKVFGSFMQSTQYRVIDQQTRDAVAMAYETIVNMMQMKITNAQGAVGRLPQAKPDDNAGGGNMDLPPQSMEEAAPPAGVPNFGAVA